MQVSLSEKSGSVSLAEDGASTKIAFKLFCEQNIESKSKGWGDDKRLPWAFDEYLKN